MQLPRRYCNNCKLALRVALALRPAGQQFLLVACTRKLRALETTGAHVRMARDMVSLWQSLERILRLQAPVVQSNSMAEPMFNIGALVYKLLRRRVKHRRVTFSSKLLRLLCVRGTSFQCIEPIHNQNRPHFSVNVMACQAMYPLSQPHAT